TNVPKYAKQQYVKQLPYKAQLPEVTTIRSIMIICEAQQSRNNTAIHKAKTCEKLLSEVLLFEVITVRSTTTIYKATTIRSTTTIREATTIRSTTICEAQQILK
ncbi:12207_t:CDS:2, partial [Ambispora gerdemannii]